MQENTIQITGDSNLRIPRSDPKAWNGYIQRQSTYLSTGTIFNPAETQTAQSFSGSVAQKLPNIQSTQVQPTPAMPVSQPIQPIYSAGQQKVNYAGTFDMLSPKPSLPAQSQKSVTTNQITPPEPKIIDSSQQSTQSTTNTPLPKSYFQASLPTDLPTSVFKDQFANIKEVKPSKLKFKFPLFSTQKLLVGMAVVLFICGAVVAGLGLRTNQEVTAQVKSISTAQATPDEDGGISGGMPVEGGNAPSVADYKVQATYPRVIRIPKTSTEARVLALGIGAAGALKTPGNIFDTGWYKDSSKPGEAGAMVVAGHVSGPTQNGVFKKLGTLAIGDTVEIERGDGEKFNYTVVNIKEYDINKVDMPAVLTTSVAGKIGLNLITCAGKFIAKTNSYEKRLVVFATQN